MSEVIKDIARQERLNQVYRHLFAHFGISSQTEFAGCLFAGNPDFGIEINDDWEFPHTGTW